MTHESSCNCGHHHHHHLPLIVDVRTPDKYESAHLDDAVNIPLEELEETIPHLVGAKSAPIAVYCTSGGKSARACKLLHEMGYTHAEDWGGIEAARAKVEGRC